MLYLACTFLKVLSYFSRFFNWQSFIWNDLLVLLSFEIFLSRQCRWVRAVKVHWRLTDRQTDINQTKYCNPCPCNEQWGLIINLSTTHTFIKDLCVWIFLLSKVSVTYTFQLCICTAFSNVFSYFNNLLIVFDNKISCINKIFRIGITIFTSIKERLL